MKSEYKIYSGCVTGFPLISIVVPAEPMDADPAPSRSTGRSSVSRSGAMTTSTLDHETGTNRPTETILAKWVSAVGAIVVTIMLLVAAGAPDIF